MTPSFAADTGEETRYYASECLIRIIQTSHMCSTKVLQTPAWEWCAFACFLTNGSLALRLSKGAGKTAWDWMRKSQSLCGKGPMGKRAVGMKTGRQKARKGWVELKKPYAEHAQKRLINGDFTLGALALRLMKLINLTHCWQIIRKVTISAWCVVKTFSEGILSRSHVPTVHVR